MAVCHGDIALQRCRCGAAVGVGEEDKGRPAGSAVAGAARDHLRAPAFAFAGAVSFRLRVLAVVLDFVADL